MTHENHSAPATPLMGSVTQRRNLLKLKPTWTGRDRLESQVSLRLGIPNTGKLKELVGELIASLVEFNYASKSLFFKLNDDLELVRARSTDLPHLLANGVVDMAITGSDYCFESGEDLVQMDDLALITGQICLLTKDGRMPGNRQDGPLVVSTQYPRHASHLVKSQGLDAEVRVVSGAGELYPRMGLSDASVDCVVTGKTAKHNHLRVAARIRPVTTGIYRRAGGDDPHKLRALEHLAERVMEACTEMRQAAMGRSI